MTHRTSLPGLVIGAFGLAVGVVGLAIDEPVLGVAAGALALAAGATNLRLARRLDDQGAAQTVLMDEVLSSRSRLADLESAETTDGTGGAPDDPAETVSPAAGVTDSPPTTAGSRQPFPIHPDHPAGRGSGDALVDGSTGLFSENFFMIALDSRIAAARRHLRPVAMVLIEVVRGLPADEPQPVEANVVAATIKETLREADTASRLQNGYFALLLEDTPENGAIWTVERIRRQLLENEPGMTVWAGIACYPAHAFSPERLLEAAEQALVSAREWRQDRIEVAAAAD